MKENKLRARWSKKEKDILATYPRGILTKCDSNYLFAKVFNDEFLSEMKKRGYDIKTLKFEIEVDKDNERFESKFPFLSEEYKKKDCF